MSSKDPSVKDLVFKEALTGDGKTFRVATRVATGARGASWSLLFPGSKVNGFALLCNPTVMCYLTIGTQGPAMMDQTNLQKCESK